MTDTDDIDEQTRAMRAKGTGGAKINFLDPRVSKALGWVWGVIGAAFTGSAFLVANNLYQLNLTVAQNAASDAIYKSEMARQMAEIRVLNERQEDHINAVDRRVYGLEGRTMRGPSGH